ncbi:MAG TPA: metalloregulator ArsR/SmtB family transcription factor [candidate division Zixibacteria bacterium]|nr:metalloregulator ArsR/SmtB family transcription factor [candidate division Zixibacteria bacterium]
MDEVFKALADPNRRALLDALRQRDGRSLGELEAVLPGMTRFGVMKHLRVLAEAGLVTVHRDGRRKLHYLNPVPVQLIADRWISRYARPWTTGLADLKASLEGTRPMSVPKHIYHIYIRTTPERLWQAITDPEMTQRYYFSSRVESDWKPGSRLEMRQPDGRLDLDGEVLEADPPRRLVHSFNIRWNPENRDAPSRVTWEIQPRGDTCLLTLTHDGFEAETDTYREVAGGWPLILSGLKTLLETGQVLEVGEPEAAAAGS